jgi:tRNA pseudouridine38-40 synthase
MPNLKLTVEYDGTEFVGWQFQKNGRSVQEEIERALSQISRTEIKIVGAGRTDAGVHARGQVAHGNIELTTDIKEFQKSVNAILPEDVVVRKMEIVNDGFHARYSAKRRRYRYFIRRYPTAIDRKYCWQLFQELDLGLLQLCAVEMLGEHEFRSFCKESDIDHYRCTVFKSQWIAAEDMLTYEIIANRFLHGMVRALVGTMVDVGRRHLEIDIFHRIFAAQDRSQAGMSAPAKGLFLEEIEY